MSDGIHVMMDANKPGSEAGAGFTMGGGDVTPSPTDYINFFRVKPSEDNSFDYCKSMASKDSNVYLNQTLIPTMNPQGFIKGSNPQLGDVYVTFEAGQLGECIYDGAKGKFGVLFCASIKNRGLISCSAPNAQIKGADCTDPDGGSNALTPAAICQWP